VNDSDYATGYGGGDRPTNADIADTVQLTDVAMATIY